MTCSGCCCGATSIHCELFRASQERKKQFARFCHHCTFHGFSDCYEEKQPVLKLVWLVCIISATTALVYGCNQIMTEYYERPIAVSYTVHHDKHPHLPDIIICPFSTLKKDFFHQHNVSQELSEYILHSFGNAVPYELFYTEDDNSKKNSSWLLASELDELLERLGMSWEQFIEAASLDCEDIVAGCIQVGQLPNYDCCGNTDQGPFLPYGRCIRLKGTEQNLAGFGFGLTILIRPIEDIVIVGKTTLMNKGISISFAPNNGSQMVSGFTFVPGGVHALLGIKTSDYAFLNNPPHYYCNDSSTKDYDEQQCFDACFFEKSVHQCGCYHFPLEGSFPDISRACKPIEFDECIFTTMQDIDAPVEMAACREKCQQPCKFREFHPRLSFAQFPSHSIMKFLNLTPASLNDYIVLDVFNEQLHVTTIKHFPTITYQQLLANIGGQMSLYVGGSILTVVQIVLFCCRTPIAVAKSSLIRKFTVRQKLKHKRYGLNLKQKQHEQQNNGAAVNNNIDDTSKQSSKRQPSKPKKLRRFSSDSYSYQVSANGVEMPSNLGL